MLDVRDLEEIQLDGLREVANIGAGHAATALSQMTQRRIMVSVPDLDIVRLEEVPDLLVKHDEIVAAVLLHILGDITGRALLILPRSSAVKLSAILLRRAPGDTEEFGELEQSAIKEAGNILCAAYMNALSDFLGMMLLPSVPVMAIDLCAAVLTSTCTNFGEEKDYVFSIKTEFTMADSESVEGHFILLPDADSLKAVLRSIRLA